MNIHQHCTMYKSNLKMQKYRRTIFQNCTKISNLSNFNCDIFKQPFFRYSIKQKEKEEAKRILPFFPLQSSILRRKTQITNPPTSHLNSNFIPNKISPIPRNEIDEKARTKKKKPRDNRIVISFSDFHQNPDRYHGPTLKGDTRYLITIVRQKCMTFPCPIYRPTREKKRSLFFLSFFLPFLFSFFFLVVHVSANVAR